MPSPLTNNKQQDLDTACIPDLELGILKKFVFHFQGIFSFEIFNTWKNGVISSLMNIFLYWLQGFEMHSPCISYKS